MLTGEQAKKLAEKVLSYSTFPECELGIDSSESAFIRFALNGITTSGYMIDQSISISSTRDGKTGSTTVNEFDDNSLREAVKRSEQLAAIAPPNPERMPSLGPQQYPSVENFADSTAAARNDAMIPHVRAIVEGAKAKSLVAAGFFERVATSASIANKRGNFGYGRTTDARISTTVRDARGTTSSWASQPAVRIQEIDGAAVGKTAIEKCLAWQNPKRLEPGKYTVVLEPAAAGDLITRIGLVLQARAAEEGRSLFGKPGGGTQVGERLFPEMVTLRTDSSNKLYSSLPWAGGRGFFYGYDGVSELPVAPVTWIDRGVLKRLSYDRYWAAKTGMEPTSSSGFLFMDGGGKRLTDLIASVERGLLVTRFWYIRTVNQRTGQLTGLTRDGLFLIENGKVTQPVVNFRFNESPVRMLQNVVAIGQPVRVRGGEGMGMIAPALVVKEFPFTSVSDAV